MVKNLPAIQETQVKSLGREDPMEEETAIHSSILTWRIPWTESLVGYSPWSSKESDMAGHAQGLKEMHSAWDTTDVQLADLI